jgi:hypothetical protein
MIPSLIFPTSSEMYAERLPELQTSYFSYPTLCQKLKVIDDSERQICSIRPEPEVLAQNFEDDALALESRAKKDDVLIKAGVTLGIVSFCSLPITTAALEALSWTGFVAGACGMIGGTVDLCVNPTVNMKCLNAEARARDIGINRIERLREKINFIHIELQRQSREKTLSDMDIAQLTSAERGFSRMLSKFIELQRNCSKTIEVNKISAKNIVAKYGPTQCEFSFIPTQTTNRPIYDTQYRQIGAMFTTTTGERQPRVHEYTSRFRPLKLHTEGEE